MSVGRTDPEVLRTEANGGLPAHRRLALLLPWLVLGFLPPAVLAQPDPRDTLPRIEHVSITGNRAFSDAEIKRAIATEASGCKSIFLRPLCWIGFSAAQRIERFDPRELRTDVARMRIFYFRRGYRHAHVDTSLGRTDGRVEVRFEVREGEPVRVRSLGIRGLEGILDSAAVAGSIELDPGDPFSEIVVSDVQESIASDLRNQGYARAEVLVDAFLPAEDSLSADLVFRAEPGIRTRIGEIDVFGVQEVDTQSVRRLLSFRSGDIYREREIVRSQRNLYSLALFDYADIAPDLSGNDSLIDVKVQVNEADIRDVRLGLGLSTTECVQAEAGWTHRNFLGGTRRLQLSARLSNILTAQLAEQFPCRQAGVAGEGGSPFNKLDWRVRADFQQPWFISAENSLRLGLFAERQSLPDIYARVTYGGDATFAREIDRGTPLTLIYRTERDSLDAGSAGLLFCANFGICRPDDINELAKTRWLSSIGVRLSRNRTDLVFDPSGGYRLTFEAEHGSRYLNSDYAFYRALGELSVYRGIGSESIVAIRVRGGWVRPIGTGIEFDEPGGALENDVTHPLKRMYAGGATTVRGVGQNLLGPKVLFIPARQLLVPDSLAPDGACTAGAIDENNVWNCDPSGLPPDAFNPRPVGGLNMLVGNLEMRFPIGGQRWRGAIFLDVGQVWSTDGGVRAPGDLAWTPGVGIRYVSPVGPLRLDVGFNTTGAERLPVVSEVRGQVVQLGDRTGDQILVNYDPLDEGGFEGFVNRLQLNFSIGQAF